MTDYTWKPKGVPIKAHNDLDDFNELFQHPDFDMAIFWRIVDSLDARGTVTSLLGS